MNRHFARFQAGMVWAALLLTPVLALAQSPYEGIYLGTYQGPQDEGEFALIVNNRGDGTLAAYDALDDRAFIEKYIHVRTDGSFQFVTRHGTRIEGQATGSDIFGRYVDDGLAGSFTGLRAAADGPLKEAAGYYSGPVTITGTGPDTNIVINSRLVAIIAADGNAFFMLDHAFPGPGDSWPGEFDFDFDFGFGEAFPRPVGHWPGGFNFDFDLDLDLDLGFGFSLDLGFDRRPPFHVGSGQCRPFHTGRGFGGWPFNSGWSYSFELSFLGLFDIVDLDFNFSLPTCHPSWQWNHFPAPIENSGGIVQIGPNGEIQDTLLDGLVLEGYLDPTAGKAEGMLFQHQGATDWTGPTDWGGHWVLGRQFSTSNVFTVEHYDRLPDVNGDGLADIQWRHAVSGENAVWLMDGAEIMAELPLKIEQDPQSAPTISTPLPAMEDPAWSAAALADFDGDTYQDILWVNRDTPDLLIWLMNGEMLLQEIYLTTEDSGQAELSGIGDFDGDGSVDILWRDHASGIAFVTLRPAEAGARDIQLGVNVTRDWQVEGIGDLDGDGTDDLIWRHSSTGENSAWLVVEAQVAEEHELMPVADPHWKIRP
jgi:hypothetical protein